MRSIYTIVGARPQFIKAAVLSRRLQELSSGAFRETIVHTGQHYDDNMSDVFFREMRIPKPGKQLSLGGKSHAAMTGEMLVALERVFQEDSPDLVLVYGDTNSTLAGALAASKIHIPVVHVEAGLRSYNKKMPEEINRVITDHTSTWLFAPTQTAVDNLRAEAIVDSGRRVPTSDHPHVSNTGDVMLEASLYYRQLAAERPEVERVLPRLKLRRPFRLLTIHRADNTDDHTRFSAICEAINSVDHTDFVFPIHPRTRKRFRDNGVRFGDHVHLIDPVGYLDMLDLETHCSGVVTDSGGVQKEAYFFRKPCVTLRDETEWVETVEAGWNVLVGADATRIRDALADFPIPAFYPELYGTGDCSERILAVLGR